MTAADKRRKFARNSLYGGIAGLGGSIGTFLASVVLARTLGVAGFGSFSYALWAAFLAALVVDVGLTAVPQRYLPELLARNETAEAGALARGLTKMVLAGCAVLLVVFPLLGFWGVAIATPGEPPIPNLIVGILAVGVLNSTVVAGFLSGLQRFDLLAVRSLVMLIVQPFAVGIGGTMAGPAGAALGYACGLLVLAAGFRSAPDAPGRLSHAVRARVVRYAIFTWASALVATFVWGRYEIFFLTAYSRPQDVGLYSVALAYALIVSTAPLLFMRGLLPHFAQHAAAGDRLGLEHSYQVTQRVVAFAIMPVCLGGAVIARPLIALVYGLPFADAASAAALMLAASAIVVPVYTAQNPVLLTYERGDFHVYSGLIGALAMTAGCLVVVPSHGLLGAALVRAIVQLATGAASCWFIASRFGIRVPYADLGRVMAAASTSALLAFMSLQVAPGLTGICVAILTGIVTYVLAVHALRVLPASDAERLARMLESLPQPLGIWAGRAGRMVLPIKLKGRPSAAPLPVRGR